MLTIEGKHKASSFCKGHLMGQANSGEWEYAAVPTGDFSAFQVRFNGEVVQTSETRYLPKPEGESIEEYIRVLQEASAGLVDTTTDFYLDQGWMFGSPSAEAGMTVSGWRALTEEESAIYYA